MRDIMMRFESLGDSCEFGIAQRHFKAEPLSLLRWAAAPLNRVITLIEARLDQFGHPDHVRIRLNPRGEYMVDETRYHITYHAWVRDGEMAPEALHEREYKRLHYLAGKLLDDLESAEKIFVVSRREIPLAQADVLPLHRGLRRFGPNTLLWVTREDEQHAAGSVEPTADGLLHGYVDRFSDPDRVPSTTSVAVWGRLCTSTWCLCGHSLDVI
jgi:hypothetical protein